MSTSAPPATQAADLTATIEDVARRVLDQHGASAFVAPRDAAIVHEASHAVVGAHEGIKVREVAISSRSVPPLGEVWGGYCTEAGGIWTSGPDTSVADDLRRARFTIAGLAGEAMAGLDKPGSSLDELVRSQEIGLNIAAKLADSSAERLWHEQVWGVAVAILRNNYEPFRQLAEHLHQHECIRGGKLRKVLAQVQRVAP
jgi:hypothetical protein